MWYFAILLHYKMISIGSWLSLLNIYVVHHPSPKKNEAIVETHQVTNEIQLYPFCISTKKIFPTKYERIFWVGINEMCKLKSGS